MSNDVLQFIRSHFQSFIDEFNNEVSIAFVPLKQLLSSITGFESLFSYVGISTLPTAQRYGILFGCIVFALTMLTVFILLIVGGSFHRMTDQELGTTSTEDDETSSEHKVIQERLGRALLLDHLVDAKTRMCVKYKGTRELRRREVMSPLMKCLKSLSPHDSSSVLNRQLLPEGYEKEYVEAYLHCQNNSGGRTPSTCPNARCEAYARAYAGCGIHTSTQYKRSYARIIESVTCVTPSSEEKYCVHWKNHPADIIGRTIRLEAVTVQRHLDRLYTATSGEGYDNYPPYDPNLLWAFYHMGPFSSVEVFRQSDIFQRKDKEAAYVVVQCMTNNILGVILLTDDNPQHLSISLESPIFIPSCNGTVEQMEACFLLLDRLFANGYRRIQFSIDSMDVQSKQLAGRLGLTQDGLFYKDRICKNSNRNSIIYAMLNCDWMNGARALLFKSIYGKKAQIADDWNHINDDKEEEFLVEQEEEIDDKKQKQILSALWRKCMTSHV